MTIGRDLPQSRWENPVIFHHRNSFRTTSLRKFICSPVVTLKTSLTKSEPLIPISTISAVDGEPPLQRKHGHNRLFSTGMPHPTIPP